MNLQNIHEAVDVHNANVSDSTFTNARMTKARFDDVDLRGATFTNANLAGVVLVDVNLTGASISNANLANVTIDGVLLEELVRCYRLAQAGARSDSVVPTQLPGAVLYAKDAACLREFYHNVLGLSVTSAASDHVVLASPTLQLVVVQTPEHVASSIAVDTPPRLRSEAPTKLIIPTASIATVRATARAFGGDVLPVDREWDFDGSRRCDGNDPEGNVFQLRESRPVELIGSTG